MPQWAGSCWYYLRYLDPTNDDALVDPEVERYWMVGTVRLAAASTSTSAAPSTRCCTSSTRASGTRCCSTSATCRRPSRSTASSTRARSPRPRTRRARHRTSRRARSRSATARGSHDGAEVVRHDGKMGKSLKNAVTPDDIYRDYGADTLRLYEMFMGPLDASRPWSTPTSSACTGSSSGSGATSSTRTPASCTSSDVPADDETRRLLHRTIDAVARRHGDARVQHRDRRADRAEQPADAGRAASRGARRDEVVRAMVLMLAPLTPHVAEELWERLGETGVARVRADFPSPIPRCSSTTTSRSRCR